MPQLTKRFNITVNSTTLRCTNITKWFIRKTGGNVLKDKN